MYVTLLLNQVTSFPVSGIGIGNRYRQTQYYSVLGIGCLSGIVLTLEICQRCGAADSAEQASIFGRAGPGRTAACHELCRPLP